MTQIEIEGKQFRADEIPLFGSSLLVIQGGKGLLGCGYLNPATAEKLGHALAIVSGVKNYDDMLNATVKSVTPAAEALGVKPGITGREALLLLA